MGHYGCGAIEAVVEDRRHGLIDNWLRRVGDIYQRHRGDLNRARSRRALLRGLCELNVREQAVNVANTTTVQDAWARGQRLLLYGWVYDIHDGILRDLRIAVDSDRGSPGEP